jgi:cell division transport system permease protein
MTLAFLISSVFGLIGYASNLFLKSVEQEPQIYAFFEIGTKESKIMEIKDQWEDLPNVAFIEYTSEEQAKDEFYEAQKQINTLAAEAVQERQLPASLAIRLNSLDNAEEINDKISETQEENSEINTILYSSEIVDNIREVFFWARLGGGIVMLLLIIVLVLFTLLTIEFRMHSRAEEIGIMQLVGGSLFFIRLPFVLEGAIYGIIGALISNTIIGSLYAFLRYQLEHNELVYLKELLVRLTWPELNIPTIVALFSSTILIGALLGSFNSYVAIRRYIK